MCGIQEHGRVQVRYLLGAAGSGKTYTCCEEIRRELAAAPEGPPLIFLTPKPGTYQVERQLLAGSLKGYSRLHILSFERLADFVFQRLNLPVPRQLGEAGRVMLLRCLVSRLEGRLELFRASARLGGFAQDLSRTLSHLQRAQLSPETLRELSGRLDAGHPLTARKLRDAGMLLEAYEQALVARGLRDAEAAIDRAARALQEDSGSATRLTLGGVWVDGFIQFASHELSLLAALAPLTQQITIALCLDHVPSLTQHLAWHTRWAVGQHTYRQCRKVFQAAGLKQNQQLLQSEPGRCRFNDPVLARLESHWGRPLEPMTAGPEQRALRLVACADPEAEARLAAREILAHVQGGGRYREVMVLVRQLEGYHAVMDRVMRRYEIPFFLDRRENVAQHPLVAHTRSALRTVALGWPCDDWFSLLKTGLPGYNPDAVDVLQNEVLARGWQQHDWTRPLPWPEPPKNPEDSRQRERLEQVRSQAAAPLQRLQAHLGSHPSGRRVAEAVEAYWEQIGAAKKIEAAGQRKPEGDLSPAAQRTIWSQCLSWLENLRLAFADESLPLRQWLPILEAGLTGLTVGVLPPALDQVIIGAVDRSRTPDVKLVILPGWNEGQFPARPSAPGLLNDADREALLEQGITLGTTDRAHTGQEQYLAYIACTRARERLVITWCDQDGGGKAAKPSSLVAHLQRLFPDLRPEQAPREAADWREACHGAELALPWLSHLQDPTGRRHPELEPLAELPGMTGLREKLSHLAAAPAGESLDPALARALYGPVLNTSISKLELFAACPFRFFLSAGLRAEERKILDVDAREQGNFQHEVLREFHEQLEREGKKWRDITAAQARERIQQAADRLLPDYQHGFLRTTPQAQAVASGMVSALQDFIEVIVGWMRSQYHFDPVAVEVPFGSGPEALPGWSVELENGCRLHLRGRIDRIDTCADPQNSGRKLAVIIDYKSSSKKLEQLFIENGLQLQLLSYLNVVKQWRNENRFLPGGEVVPAGVFFAPLKPESGATSNRDEALVEAEASRRKVYQHDGRFDLTYFQLLDSSNQNEGEQFRYRRKRDGGFYANTAAAMPPAAFEDLLSFTEKLLRDAGERIYRGEIGIEPYRQSAQKMACTYCVFTPVCRIDPWTHRYRKLSNGSLLGENAPEELQP